MSCLYHYTSQSGLLGILTSKSVWATNVQFLNDPTEFVHAIRHASDVASHYFFEYDDYFEYFGWLLGRKLREAHAQNLYVTSFSEKPDLLSQWRGYCPSGSGYCLGFDRKAVEMFCHEQGMRIEKCLYGNELQQSEVIDLIASGMGVFPTMPIPFESFTKLPTAEKLDALEAFRAHVDGPGSMQAHEALTVISESLVELAPRFKHEGFHEEAEWRVIAHDVDLPIHFRPGPSYLVPYMSLALLQFDPAALREVIIGPNPNQVRAKAAVQIALEKLGYAPEIVRCSKIPFNNW